MIETLIPTKLPLSSKTQPQEFPWSITASVLYFHSENQDTFHWVKVIVFHHILG
jgi:hypothetical protein